jgi:hypothetical protein
MNQAVDYLAHIKALIVLSPHVLHWTILREETIEELGLFRYRLTLHDGSRLEMFERFQVTAESVTITKYSFHWQDADGQLLKRWDNAAHHPEVSTHPHHVYDGSDDNVLAHDRVNAEAVLEVIAEDLART